MLSNELCRFIGETVTIFTTSGGVSGCGFTGVLIRVNPCFVTLVNRFGTAPSSPISKSICPPKNGCGDAPGSGKDMTPFHSVGSVCDIPVDKIAAFCHNAI